MLDPAIEPPPAGRSPLLIERTFEHDRERDLGGARLTYREDALQFEYSLLTYFRDDETRYRTQIIGLEAQPTD